MNNKEVIKQLKAVQSMNLPKMNYEKLKEYHGKLSGFKETEENIKAMDEYLGKFLDTRNEYCKNGCWLCESKYISLSWGLAHGVSHSECCGLSYKQYHYPKDVGREDLFYGRIEMSLQYHPDGFEIDEEGE